MSIIFNRLRSRARVLRGLINNRKYATNEQDKVRIDILNKGDTLMIDSFSQIGFRLNNGIFVMGSIAIFPRSVVSWKVNNCNEINEKSLSLFTILEPKLEILVIGVENNYNNTYKNNIYIHLKKHGINVEILPTEQACTTFNFLNSESRYVAGAMIPPLNIRFLDDDYSESKRRKELIELTD